MHGVNGVKTAEVVNQWTMPLPTVLNRHWSFTMTSQPTEIIDQWTMPLPTVLSAHWSTTWQPLVLLLVFQCRLSGEWIFHLHSDRLLYGNPNRLIGLARSPSIPSVCLSVCLSVVCLSVVCLSVVCLSVHGIRTHISETKKAEKD